MSTAAATCRNKLGANSRIATIAAVNRARPARPATTNGNGVAGGFSQCERSIFLVASRTTAPATSITGVCATTTTATSNN